MVLVVGGLGFVLVRDYSTSSPATTTITTDITHGQGCVLWFVQRHVMMMYEQTLDFIPSHSDGTEMYNFRRHQHSGMFTGIIPGSRGRDKYQPTYHLTDANDCSTATLVS